MRFLQFSNGLSRLIGFRRAADSFYLVSHTHGHSCFSTRKLKTLLIAGEPVARGDERLAPDTGPRVIVKERKGKFETLERHVPQLLVRGEQVVLIAKID